MKYLIIVVLVVLGAAGLVLGEADDSPGLQGIGLLLIIGAVVYGWRSVRRSRT